MTSIKQDIPKINISIDVEEDNSSNSSGMKEAEDSSSSSSISFEDKKVIGENTTNTNTVKNDSQEKLPEPEEEKKGKRRKRDSFKRIKKEGEVLVKSLTGMFGKEKSSNKKQELDNHVPQNSRTKYHKSSSSSSSSEARQKRHSLFSSENNNSDDQPKGKARDYPLSDDDNLKTSRKTRNRLSINFSDLMKQDDDKKEKENRRRTFHFSNNDYINNYENNTDKINNGNSSSGSKLISVETKFKSILPTTTTEYDSPITENFTVNSAPTTNKTNTEEQQVEVNDFENKEQKSNETREVIITTSMTSAVINTSLDEKEEDNKDVVEQNSRRISDISNDTEISDNQIHNITNGNDNNTNNQEKSMITSASNNILPDISLLNSTMSYSIKNSQSPDNIEESEEQTIIYKYPEFKFPTHDNEIDNKVSIIVKTGEANHHNKIEKTEIKLEENSKINMLETIVLRQLVLAEKMQETMSRLEFKVSGQVEDTILKLENKINQQNVELDDLKTIVGKLQESQQMMIANEAYYNQDLQTIHRELALVSQPSSISSFPLTPNLHQQTYMKDTLVDTLVVKPLYKTITISASVMYAVYVQPVVSLVRVVKQRL